MQKASQKLNMIIAQSLSYATGWRAPTAGLDSNIMTRGGFDKGSFLRAGLKPGLGLTSQA